MKRRTEQQSALARLNEQAQNGTTASELLHSAARHVAAAMDDDFCEVLQSLPGNGRVKLVAGSGWDQGCIGESVVATGPDSHAGQALLTREPVIIRDLKREDRFQGSQMLRDHQVISGLSVVIGPMDHPWGVLGTHSSRRVDYTSDDVFFLQETAALLWNAIEHERQQDLIEQQRDEIEELYNRASVGVCVFDRQLKCTRANEQFAALLRMKPEDLIGKSAAVALRGLGAGTASNVQHALTTGDARHDVELRAPKRAGRGNGLRCLADFVPFRVCGEVAGVQLLVREFTEDQSKQGLIRRNETLEKESEHRADMIEMLHDIATFVHESTSLIRSVEYILQRVSEFNGWSYGHAYVVAPDEPDLLVPLQVHFANPRGRFSHFHKRISDQTIDRGEGLAGRAFSEARAIWAGAESDDLGPFLKREMPRLSLQSAAAFPIAVNDQIELVLEFFSSSKIEDDERLRRGMEDVGVHLSRTIERLRADLKLRESEQRFRELAESVNLVFWVLDPATDRMHYVSPEWARIVGEPESEVEDAAERWWSYLHPDDKAWVVAEFAAKADRGDFDVVYRIVRADGEVRWIRDVAVAALDEAGSARRIIGVAQDITQSRALEREVANATTREQQRLSKDLQDSIGQELTGLTMMAQLLTRSLSEKLPAESSAADHLAAGLRRTLQQVRRISKGLAPVDIETGGLTVALSHLAEQTSLVATSNCVFRCDQPVTISDVEVVGHLYRIAQEAVANAVKYAQARTIVIELQSDGEFCELSISDDGCGIAETPGTAYKGIGFKIMRYRADMIGAKLTIHSRRGEGTQIQCRVRREDHAADAARSAE